MKNIKNEYIQRIPAHYVGRDCIHIMISNFNNGTILNSSGMTYHYMPDSNFFINKYTSDERIKQFPFSQIPTHISKTKGLKVKYINQLLDFNRVYIEISNGIVKEDYVIKDGDEALLATKYIFPNQESTKFINRKEVEELLNSANGGVYSINGGHYFNISLPSDECILDCYKKQIIEINDNEDNTYLDESFYKIVEKMTIDDVPKEIIIDSPILFFVKENEIKSIKNIILKFMGPNKYMVEFYDLPITIYNLNYMKQLECTNSIKISEPKFSRFISPKIDFEYVKKEKKRILSLKQSQKIR